MTYRIVAFLIAMTSINPFFAQKKDSSFYFLNKYELKKAIAAYEKKIIKFKYIEVDEKSGDAYNLACAYSLVGNAKNCYKNLKLCFDIEASEKNSKLLNSSRDLFFADADFYNMLKDDAWQQFVRQNARYEKQLPDSLFFTLSKIAIRDQALYKEIYYCESKYGLKSKKVANIWKTKDTLNKLNFKSIEDLMNQGTNVLSATSVGQFFATRCFLVIQHSDTATMVKYLPVIKQLYEKGETSGENYALLYDRVFVNRNKGQQYYGTQVNSETNTPYPIKNEINVDKRRKELGMEPLKDYLLKFGIFYKPKK
jgi:hypothetical protein